MGGCGCGRKRQTMAERKARLEKLRKKSARKAAMRRKITPPRS